MKIFEISWMVSVLRLLQVKAKGPRLTWKGEAVEEDSTLSDDSAPRKRSRTLPLASRDAPHDEVSSGVIWKLRKANWTTVKRGRNLTHFSQVLCGWRVAPDRHLGTFLLLSIARFDYNTHKSTFILTCIGAAGCCLYHSCRQLTGIG